MGDSDSGYQFGTGIGEEELGRLEIQGRALAPATRMIFAEAGIRSGMRVLDLGCGAGDVAFVAADLAGPDGSVLSSGHAQERLIEGPSDSGEQRRRPGGERELVDLAQNRPGLPSRSSTPKQMPWAWSCESRDRSSDGHGVIPA